AEAGGSTDSAGVRARLQTLLADRFHLVAHMTTRNGSRLALVIAKGGPKLTPAATPDCSAPGARQPCGDFDVRMRSQLSGYSVTPAQLAYMLSWLNQIPINDQTGLGATYDMHLSRGSRRLHCGQSRREGLRKSAGRPAPGKQCRRGPRERSTGMGLRGPHAGASTSRRRPETPGAWPSALGPAPIKQWTPDPHRLSAAEVRPAPAPDPNAPSLFTALEEQLGLKLVAGNGPIPILQVDHAQAPTAN